MSESKDFVKYYYTSDLAVTATLLCLGFELVEMKEKEGSCTFVFDESQELRETLTRYLNKKLRVEPSELAERIREVKGMIYSRVQK